MTSAMAIILMPPNWQICRQDVPVTTTAVKYSVQEKQEEIVGCAAEIYDKYDFLRQHVSRKLVNRTVCYEMKSRRHLVSGLLQILFCARREYFHYRQYKVVRLFNLIVYKKLIPEA